LHPKTDGKTPDLYQQLLRLLESSINIENILRYMKSKTQRIPVQHMSRFYFLSFSRSNQNKLYLMSVLIFEVLLSLFGASIAL
jgi:hypothetical protein